MHTLESFQVGAGQRAVTPVAVRITARGSSFHRAMRSPTSAVSVDPAADGGLAVPDVEGGGTWPPCRSAAGEQRRIAHRRRAHDDRGRPGRQPGRDLLDRMPPATCTQAAIRDQRLYERAVVTGRAGGVRSTTWTLRPH
jgi:hypothetical protein